MNTPRTNGDTSKPRLNLDDVRSCRVVSTTAHIVVPLVHTSRLDAEYGCVEWFNYAGSGGADTQEVESALNLLEKSPQPKSDR